MTANKHDVIIVGAGPAGSSAAIHLAKNDLRVLLVEQRKFPRPKLCGEFISPECLAHFERLGVLQEIRSYGPASIARTTFYSESGRSVTVPSGWFGSGSALGLSRAAMDNALMRRAQRLGVTVLENSIATETIIEDSMVRGIRVRRDGAAEECFKSALVIDATGRSCALVRRTRPHQRSRAKLIGFKAHLTETRVANGSCEIYSYPRGYGGISTVEEGLSNLCFITSAEDVRNYHSSPEAVLRHLFIRNQRAAYVLRHAKVVSPWLSVSLDSFGRQRPSLVPGLIAIGDAAAFIDPFTGSGILMALESGQLAADSIVRNAEKLTSPEIPVNAYTRSYRRKFLARLMFCSVLRRTAFNPRLAEFMIGACRVSEWLRSHIALATRSNSTLRSDTRDP